VSPGAYYADAVTWAANNGIIRSGDGSSTFAPDENITRQDLAVILSRYADVTGVNLGPTRESAVFRDVGTIADYARAAVDRLYRSGIMNGHADGTVAPGAEATRAEVAAMMRRFMAKMDGVD
jgi:hypothetical protein